MRAIPCPIPINELRALYEVQKLTDQQIVERLGGCATIKRVRSWRRHCQISTIHRAERHDVPLIEGCLLSLLVGSMLGDGRLVKRVHTTHYIENHCDDQRDYAEWKRQQWGSWVKNELKPVTWHKPEGDFSGVRFHTVAHASLNEWHDLFYTVKGPKLPQPPVVELVDELALAIWYLDDGCAGWWPMLTLASTSRAIACQILDRFSVSGRWVFMNGGTTTGQLLLEGVDNAHRFIELIRPHIPECMSHKLDFGFQGPHYQVRQSAPERRLEELAEQGVPIREIARRLGVGATTVDRYLRGFGIDHPRTIGRPPTGRDD